MAKSDPKRGVFITFEGAEGAGKSSQIALLEKRLKKARREVVVTREPGGTPGAEIIRHVVLGGHAEALGPHMEAILFSAARADHIEFVIAPALKEEKIVLCDRFIDSTRVYQGISGKVGMEFLTDLEDVVCEYAWPDLTILLDLDPVEGMKRADARRAKSEAPDRFEKEGLKEQKKRRAAFLKIAKAEPKRFAIINAHGTMAEVSDRIWDVVKPLVRKKSKAD
jgi:dTMP kinase